MAGATHRGRSRLEDYLNDHNDLSLPAHLAARSRLPCTESGPSNGKEKLFHPSGTSMLLENSSATSCNSLPGLSFASTQYSAQSIASSEGKGFLDQRLRLLDVIPSGTSVLPRARPVFLECPFSFLSCHQRFHSYGDWYRHGITHFRGIEPPQRNKCCFCDLEFYASTGKESWRQRSEHIALHHQLGHSLAHARVDLNLYQYLWRENLVSTADLVSGSRGLLPDSKSFSFVDRIADQ